MAQEMTHKSRFLRCNFLHCDFCRAVSLVKIFSLFRFSHPKIFPMPQELYQLSGIVLSPQHQQLLLLILVWLGWMGMCGYLAQIPFFRCATLSVREIMIIGVLGTTLGLFAWTWLLAIQIESFNPINVAGGVASVTTGIFITAIWRFSRWLRPNPPQKTSIEKPAAQKFTTPAPNFDALLKNH